MKKPLYRPLINNFFCLMNWRIQKPLIILDFGGLERLQSLVAMQILIIGGRLLALHLLIIWMHLVTLSIGKHILRGNRVLLHFRKSLI